MRRPEMVEIDLKELRERLLKEVEKAIDNVLRDISRPKPKYNVVKDFIDIGGKKFKVVVVPTRELDKVVVYLYKAGKRLNVVGEVVAKEGRVMFYPYEPFLYKIAHSEKVDYNKLIHILSDVVSKKEEEIAKFVDVGARIRMYEELVKNIKQMSKEEEEEDPAILAYKVSLIEDEMKKYLEENQVEYVPDNVLRHLLKKQKISLDAFTLYVRGFYEKEPGKWYPIRD